MTAPGPDVLPRKFGRYQLFDRIGRGGMAEIYLARAELEAGIARLVVVKQIHPHLSRDEAFSRAFVDEAKLAADLRHANITQVVDLGRSEERDGALLFMAMEYVEGLDLSQLLRRLSQKRVPLPLELAILIVREVLVALDVAHRATDRDGVALGLVHRDVSPSNVLLSFDGEVKLCDFGIAKAMGPAGAESIGGAKVVGKSAYMSPEHAKGEAIDARADVFAAGILLWELCSGRRLYKGSEEEMLAMARQASVPPLPEGLPHGAALQAIASRALHPDREQRFASARAFMDALQTWSIEARIVPSPIRFGAFLEEHIGLDEVATRRSKERAAAALEKGPPVVMEPLRSSQPPERAPTPQPAQVDLLGPSGEVPLGELTVPNQPSLAAPPSALPAVPAAAFAPQVASAEKPTSRWRAVGFVAAFLVVGALAAAIGFFAMR